MNANVIPPMTHPYAQYWDQPSADRILIDDTHAVVDEHAFNYLPEYSGTIPTGVYPGKTWKCYHAGKWWLRWYGECDDPSKCSINTRELLVLEGR